MAIDPRIARENTATVVEKAHVKHQSKRDLRACLLNARAALPAAERIAHDAVIAAAVEAWLMQNPVQILGVYWPIRSEPNLRDLYAALAARGVRLALPVVVGVDAPLLFAAWAPGDAVILDRWGIATPDITVAVRPQALLIPCVGYDARGFRLGYGAGYYDRTLATHPPPQAIGIAYTTGLATFDVEPHDRALDVVITEAATGSAPHRAPAAMPE